ncbi:MAG: hypothetical protein HOV81_12665 [Kofleriaceae bacterium]|nr:hypothetical protein [Kofleriaceae bacterium]
MTAFANWQTAFAIAVAVLAARVAVMAWAVARRRLAWSRLLLPGIILVESASLWWHDRTALWQLRLGTALALEITFIAIAIREVRRSARGSQPLEARLARAFVALLPPLAARLVALELVIVGSALGFLAGGWRRAVPTGFTYHRECGLRILLPILPLLGIGDILLLELVILPHATMWLRVLLHVLALYGLVWIIGFYASLRARPHQLVDGRLTLHRGLLRRVDVPVPLIASIEPLPSFADDWKKRAYTRGAIRIDVAGPPVLELRLHDAVRPIGVLGEGAAATRVLVSVDDPASLLRELRP